MQIIYIESIVRSKSLLMGCAEEYREELQSFLQDAEGSTPKT